MSANTLDQRQGILQDKPETLTILQCAEGLRLCKLVRKDGKISDYDSAKYFSAAEVSVHDLTSLGQRLRAIQNKPRCCVVRGSLVNGPRVERMRRLAYAERSTGDPATLDDVARRWLALDMDDVPLPDGVNPSDVAECAQLAIAVLPGVFHGARCLAQATAGHGIKPGIRLRLWFWLNRPLTAQELTKWLKSTPVDVAVFRAAQPIYTAAPVFENPDQDPVPNRIVELTGCEHVAAPAESALLPNAAIPVKAVPLPSDTHAQRYAARAMVNAAIRVSSAPVNSRHKTCVQQARSLGRLVEAGLLTGRQVCELLAGALEQSGKDKAEGRRAALWGIDHASTSALPRFGGS